MYDDDNVSNKSQMTALILLLIFGRLGIHRFYVGKYLSGIIFLLIGGTSIVMDFMGVGYTFIIQVVYLFIMALDVYALYSDSFIDSKGKLLTDSKVLKYDTLKEREEILFTNKLNKILCIVFGIVFYAVYHIIIIFVL